MKRMPDKRIQKLATQLYLSGKCKSLEDAYKQAEVQLAGPFDSLKGPFFNPFGGI